MLHLVTVQRFECHNVMWILPRYVGSGKEANVNRGHGETKDKEKPGVRYCGYKTLEILIQSNLFISHQKFMICGLWRFKIPLSYPVRYWPHYIYNGIWSSWPCSGAYWCPPPPPIDKRLSVSDQLCSDQILRIYSGLYQWMLNPRI